MHPAADGRDNAALKTVFVDNRPTAKRLRKSKLVVLEGQDAGQELEVAAEEVTVGRSPVCDLTLTDPSVSTQHFSILADDRGYVLRDVGSTNGTFYGDVRIREIFLRPGTVFRAGKTILKFQPTADILTIALSDRDRFGEVIGTSVPMRQIFAQLERIASTELTVLVQGETGTGKELVARAIHDESPRAKKPFVVLDCSAIPRELIESTLFGHEKGSFTGAISQHRGVFEQADGGTIFLDEIGELDLSLQPKLLRVLEGRELKRVGSDKTLKVDVRVVAATNRDLREMVTRGGFREDLYFRLSVVAVTLPPLRKRPRDVPTLVDHFVARANDRRIAAGRLPLSVSADALQALQERPWPGNIRELKNVCERAIGLGDGPLLTRGDFFMGADLAGLPPPASAPEPAAAPAALAGVDGLPEAPRAAGDLVWQVDPHLAFKDAKQSLLDAFEAVYLARLMDAHSQNISQASRAAGLTRYHLRELLKKHGIHKG